MTTENMIEKYVEYRATVLNHPRCGTNLQIIEDNIQEVVFTHSFVPSTATNIIVMIKRLVEDYPDSYMKRPLAVVCSFT